MRRLYAVRFGDAGFMGPRGEVVPAVRRAWLPLDERTCSGHGGCARGRGRGVGWGVG
jgi:hypothetical protein